MLNNAKLKETLSQIMTAKTAEPIHASTATTAKPSGCETILPSLSVVLTFSLSLEEAPSQMNRIQEMARSLGLQSAVQQQPTPLPTTAPPLSQIQVKHTESTVLMSDKQKSLISNLVKRKRLTARQVEDMVRNKFGINDRALLDKWQASQLIDLLMAM